MPLNELLMFSVVNHLSIDPRFGNFQMCETDFNSIFFSYFSVPIKSNFYFQQTKMCKIQNETLLQIKFCKQGVTNVSHFIAIDSIVLREKKKSSMRWTLMFTHYSFTLKNHANEICDSIQSRIIIGGAFSKWNRNTFL